MLRRLADSFGVRIAIDCTDPDVLRCAIPWLPHGWQEDASWSECDRVYTISAGGDTGGGAAKQYLLAIDGVHAFRSCSFDTFADYFENDVHHFIATYSKEYLFVHAGAVGCYGRAILVPGRSYAGKSTLTRALVEAGTVYYSDDYAIVDSEGLVWPFPRQLRMRMDRSFPQRRVNPFDQGWSVGREPIPVGLVAALTFDEELGWDARSVSEGAGVLALLSHTVAARERPIDAMGFMAKAIAGSMVLEGTRGEADVSARRLIQMLDATS